MGKQFVHIGPTWPGGRTYLVPTAWASKFKADPQAYGHLVYGLYRTDGVKVGAKIKAMTKGQLTEEVVYVDNVPLAIKWLKAKANAFDAPQGSETD